MGQNTQFLRVRMGPLPGIFLSDRVFVHRGTKCSEGCFRELFLSGTEGIAFGPLKDRSAAFGLTVPSGQMSFPRFFPFRG